MKNSSSDQRIFVVFNLKSTTWDVKRAVGFKDLQRKIVSSIVTSCYSGRRLVEYEAVRQRAKHYFSFLILTHKVDLLYFTHFALQRMAHASKISRSIIQPGHSENVETSGDGLHRS